MVAPPSTQPKRIFVIGPMTAGQRDNNGLPIEQHIPNIVEATWNVLEKLSAKFGGHFPEWKVIDPPNRPTGIPRDVFSHIMHCDFAIADISSTSPNVMYEVAMLHANGTPVIFLGDPVFYLNQQSCINCTTFEVAEIEVALSGDSFDDGSRRVGQLELMMTSPPSDAFSNPITEFFGGVHMVNMAAAAGVATGNFYNFTMYILEEGIFKKNPDLEKLILIRPESIEAVTDCIRKLEQEFSHPVLDRETQEPVVDHEGKPKMRLPQIRHDDEKHPRGGYFAYRIGNHIVDYPTPISSLSASKQYTLMKDYRNKFPGGFQNDELVIFEKRMIEVYFDTLYKLAEQNVHCNWSRVEVLSIEDAIEFFRTSS